MKAIQMTETGVPEVLRLVEIPDPTPGPGEVLIKVESAAVAIAGLPIQTFPLAEAAHRLLENGASIGKLILKP
jgi:NADPH:quinone reductase-like Zn-dependent oxidoreductase